MKLLIFKHGKTDLNIAGRRQGRTDLPLNDIGRKQVKELKESIKEEFDVIIVSPMRRTFETAKILFPNRKLITNDLLIEYDFGELEGEPFSKTPKEFPDNKTMLYNNIEFILPNKGETFEEITNRCRQFIKYLKNNFDKNSTIAIVTHSTNMEIIKALVENKPWHTYLGKAKQFHGMVEVEL